MTLLRVLYAESLKLKRTIALKMVVLAPAIIVLLTLFLCSQAPVSTLHRHGVYDEWMELTRLNLKVWALLMMPLYITLQTALVAGLDHSENQWKSLLARPVPRWTFYMTKLFVAASMTVGATLCLLCGTVISGMILPKLQPALIFKFPLPWTAMLLDGAQMMGLAFLALTLQHWVSLRWRSFSVATGAGIIATVVGFFCVAAARHAGDWPQFFPWSLPMLVLGKEPLLISPALSISSALGFVVAAAGCWDFCRREV